MKKTEIGFYNKGYIESSNRQRVSSSGSYSTHRKGFVISLDAIIAISFFLFALMILASQSYTPTTVEDIYLKQLTMDTMSVLEKTGRIDQAFNDNTSAIQEILEATPKLACIKIFILNSSSETVISALKSDCNETMNLNVQTIARPALYQGNRYIIKSESWFRKEPN